MSEKFDREKEFFGWGPMSFVDDVMGATGEGLEETLDVFTVIH
jgi:hypothetical protein